MPMTEYTDGVKRKNRSMVSSCSTYQVSPRYRCRWIFALLRRRGRRPRTRYQDELKMDLPLTNVSYTPAHSFDGSGDPVPDLQSEPVHGFVRPDPNNESVVDLDFSDAFHSRLKALRCGVQLGFDPEIISSLAGRRYRRYSTNLEGQGIIRRARKYELALLLRSHVGDIPLVHLQDHAVRIERSYLKQNLPALYRNTQGLAKVADYDHAIEGRFDPRARDLFVEQFDLGPRLRNLSEEDLRL